MMLEMRLSKERVNVFQVDTVRACHHNTRQTKLKETAMQKEHGIFRKLELSIRCEYPVLFLFGERRGFRMKEEVSRNEARQEDWYQRLLVVFHSILLLSC